MCRYEKIKNTIELEYSEEPDYKKCREIIKSLKEKK